MSTLRVDTIQPHSTNTITVPGHLVATSFESSNKATFRSAVDVLDGKLKSADLSATDAVISRELKTLSAGSEVTGVTQEVLAGGTTFKIVNGIIVDVA